MLEGEEASKAVEYWMQLLSSEHSDTRLRAAIELGRLGVRTRPSADVRGTLRQGASRRLAMGEEAMRPAIQALLDERPEVRREAAFALGEWLGEVDELGIRLLRLIAQCDPDSPTRIAATEALGKIGGGSAIQTLTDTLLQDPDEDVRAQALSSLGDLLVTAAPGDKPDPQLMDVVRQKIQDGDEPSWYVRQLAIGTVEAVETSP